MIIYISEQEKQAILEGDVKNLRDKLNGSAVKEAYEEDDISIENLVEIISSVLEIELIDEPFLIELSPNDLEEVDKGLILVRHTKRHDMPQTGHEAYIYFVQYEYDLERKPSLFNPVKGTVEFKPNPDEDLELELDELEKELDSINTTLKIRI